MINKIYKRIHNKYSNIFKFFFFLRHLFAIFLIFTSLFFLIPKFFNYEKKQDIIKEHLLKNYDLEVKDFSKIEYQIFPLPNLSIKNVNFKIKNKSVNLKTNKIDIFLEIKKIYNYENFKTKKIILNNTEVLLDISSAKNIINYIKKLKNNLVIKNLSLNFEKDSILIFKIKNINFSNYGNKKYHFAAEAFNKKLKAFLINNNKNLNFKILKTGIKADIEFSDTNSESENNIVGSSKIKLLNNLLKFDFNLDNNKLKIKKSNFRNKKLSFSFDSRIKFNPYFNFNTDININEIDKNILDSVSLDNILKNRKLIKKLSSKININYKDKSYFTNFIESYVYNLNFAYGRLEFVNKILIKGGEINCQGNSLLTEKYPRLNFFCKINIKDKKQFFKKFSITKNINADLQKLNIEGSLNLFYKKVSFNNIDVNKNYIVNKEDIKYFKETFENILFSDGFFKIFKKSKIKEFLLAII